MLKRKDILVKIKEKIIQKEVPKKKKLVNKKYDKNEVQVKEKKTGKNNNKVQFMFEEDIANIYNKNNSTHDN